MEIAHRGEDVVITDRGRAIARLVAHHEQRPVDRLIEAGLGDAASPAEGRGRLDAGSQRRSVSDLIER